MNNDGWCYFMIDMCYQHSDVLNYVASPTLFLPYRQCCPVARVQFPVAMDIIIQIKLLSTIL